MYPKLTIDLAKVRSNMQALAKLAPSIALYGVTKACLGSAEIANAMISGGAAGLADSRLKNLKNLRNKFNVPLMLLRQPMIEEVDLAVRTADHIVVTELAAAEALSRAALNYGKKANLLLMLEMGDRRDGVTDDEFIQLLESLGRLKAVNIIGLAANVGCSFGVKPTKGQLLSLIELKRQAHDRLGIDLPVLSGGNSGCLQMLLAGDIPPEINQLRLGEAILLGNETIDYRTIPGLFTDAFILEAEVIEVKQKCLEAGDERRAVLALGLQDIASAPLTSLVEDVNFSARSSDHLVLSVNEESKIRCGEHLKFVPSYFALLAAMTSPYVEKVFVGI